MKYLPIGKELFSQNRENFRAKMPPGSIAIFNSNDIMPTNADGAMPFRQNSDIFYLSGIDQEETILVMYPDFYDQKLREVLFLKETSDNIAIWEGHKYTKDEATQSSGIETTFWLSAFETTLNTLLAEATTVFLNTNEHIRAVVRVETREARFGNWCREKYPLHQYQRSALILHELRAVKSEREIEIIQEACNITERGFRRILDFVKPGVMEFEIEAEFMYEFLRNRSRGFAYEPIVASGPNACVLHYISNNQACRDGDIILLDIGAEYANYNADMTRSIPANGRYTDRQKAVYDAVLRVKKECEKMLVPGNEIPDYHFEVGKIMESELVGLGLLEQTDIDNQDPKNPAYRRFFMHGTSHHLGLDVHDVGNIYQKMKSGMVFTVEPGIYIREEGLGIRLEDNVVITEDGLINLMKNIPIEAEEIEELMNP